MFDCSPESLMTDLSTSWTAPCCTRHGEQTNKNKINKIMKNGSKLLLMAGFALAVLPSQGQLEITEDLGTYDVTNEGLVVGAPTAWNSPYYLWNPGTGELTEIGGVSAGEGIGGVARFTDDGKKVAAVMLDSITLPLVWDTATFDAGILITDMLFPYTSFMGVAVGKIPGVDTVVLKQSSNGSVWRSYEERFLEYGRLSGNKGGLECVAVIDDGDLCIVGGENGALYYGNLGGGSWNPIPGIPDSSTDPHYRAVDFIQAEPYVGLIGGEKSDGTPFLWQSPDGASSFDTAISGLAGVPLEICHTDSAFFLVTANGAIQKSTDQGLTWREVFRTEDSSALNGVAFRDVDAGLAVGAGAVYFTSDGGSTWSKKTVAEGGLWSKQGKTTEDVVWNDVLWIEDVAVVAGSEGNLWKSVDERFDFWTPMENPMQESGNDILAIGLASNGVLSIAGEGGCFYGRTFSEEATKVCKAVAAVYDLESDTWTALPTFGRYQDISASNAYHVSGDGSTVVGSVYAYESNDGMSTTNSHAAAWVEGELIDLGTRFPGEYTRASAASYDGSVIVGHQDKLGPWMAAIWTRNEDGTYDSAQILFGEGVTEDDVDWDNLGDMSKVVGEAHAVSPDGKWVGGYGKGNVAFDAPWLYNRETGEYTLLAEGDYATGCVSAMNNDATVVVGWNGNGESGWIWTQQDGQMELNAFVTEKLGVEIADDMALASVYSMSENGRYICGYGIRSDQSKFGYRIDLKEWLDASNEESGRIEAAVYPNPVSTELHVDLLDDSPAMMRLYDLSGRLVMEKQTRSVSNVLNVEGLNEGVYLLQVTLDGKSRAFKVAVVR